MENSFEIKTDDPEVYSKLKFGMTPKEIEALVRKMKKDNDMKIQH